MRRAGKGRGPRLGPRGRPGRGEDGDGGAPKTGLRSETLGCYRRKGSEFRGDRGAQWQVGGRGERYAWASKVPL